MNTYPPQIVFQEVPDQISLAFTVMGCPLKCPGCHSQDTWQISGGTPLTDEDFSRFLAMYSGLITCVLFFGGEWHLSSLIQKLKIARRLGLKTCLYTGATQLPKRLTEQLDYLKTGPWIEALGGLETTSTNQIFRDLNSGDSLNSRFINQL